MKNLLNKLKWHSEYDFNKVVIWYVSRGMPDGIDSVKGEDVIKMDKYYIETKKAFIPYHRIKKIEYEGKVLFRR